MEWLEIEAHRRRNNMKELKKREDEKLAEACTFQPKINKGPSTRRQYLPTFERLSASRQAEYEKRESLKKKQVKEEEDTYSFKPSLSKMTESYATQKRRHTTGQMESLGDKLYSDAKLIEQKHRIRVKEVAKSELDGLFKPKIETPGGTMLFASPRRPLHERLDEIKKEKTSKLYELRQKWIQEEELTFKPSICARSRSVQPPQTTSSHLTHPHDRGSPECGGRENIKGKPSISTRSRALAETSEDYKQHSDFLERQMYLNRKRDTELQMKRMELDEEQNPNHTPQRSQHDIDTAISNIMQRSKVNQERINYMRSETVSGFFKPKVCRNASFNGTSTRPSKQATVEKIRAELDEKEQKEVTLKPRINRKSRQIAARRSFSYSGTPYGKSNDAMESARRKRKQELKKEEEECTFQPATNTGKPIPAANYDADVSGMQQFLQRQEAARRNVDDKKRREQELSMVKPSAISNIKRRDECGRLHTVPKPFKLSENRSQPPKAETFSFHPHTNESKRDDLLRRVLEEINSSPSRDWSQHDSAVTSLHGYEDLPLEPPIERTSSHSHLFGMGSEAQFEHDFS